MALGAGLRDWEVVEGRGSEGENGEIIYIDGRSTRVIHAWSSAVRQTYAHLDKGSKQYGVS